MSRDQEGSFKEQACTIAGEDREVHKIREASIFKCSCLMQGLGAEALGGGEAADMMGPGGQGAIRFSVLNLVIGDEAWQPAQEFLFS